MSIFYILKSKTEKMTPGKIWMKDFGQKSIRIKPRVSIFISATNVRRLTVKSLKVHQETQLNCRNRSIFIKIPINMWHILATMETKYSRFDVLTHRSRTLKTFTIILKQKSRFLYRASHVWCRLSKSILPSSCCHGGHWSRPQIL